MTVSVALAVYRGGEALLAQIDSVLPQLTEDDELILCVDRKDTESPALLALYREDPRVRIVTGGDGVVPNFEIALRSCEKELIFLCDQDDLWKEDKIARVKEIFFRSPATLLVQHDAVVTDGERNILRESFYAMHGVKHGIFANLCKNSFMGCCMAFRRCLLEVALPFPGQIPMHDQWIGLIAEQAKGVTFAPFKGLEWRRHGNNASQTKHASFGKMLRFRLGILTAFLSRYRKIHRFAKEWKKSNGKG